MKIILPLLASTILIGLTACTNSTETPTATTHTTPSDSNTISDTSNQQANTVEPPKATTISYVAWPIKNSDSLKKVYKNFNEEEIKIIESLNRADKKHLTSLDTLIIPTTFGNLLDYSPFPAQLAAINHVPKLIFFDYPLQAYAVYENGQLIKWGPTNMGKKATPTPTGLFFANWKGLEIRSSVNKSWILKWNFNVHNTQGVGWHEYALPGYPASHSCMRLLAEDAKWLYTWADQWQLKAGVQVAKGTPTIIYGDYPWGERRPWKSLLEDPNSITISKDSLNNIVAPYLDKIAKAQEERNAYYRNTIDTLTN